MRERLLIGLAACLLAACSSRPPAGTEAAAKIEPPPAESRPSPTRARAAPAAQPARPADSDIVYFQSGSTEIEAGERLKLPAHAERLKADPRLVVTLVGHTDDQGSPSYNLAIAQGRVDAVFAALRRLGVPARQMQRYPVGREKMEVGCTTVECRRAMRRVELVYRD